MIWSPHLAFTVFWLTTMTSNIRTLYERLIIQMKWKKKKKQLHHCHGFKSKKKKNLISLLSYQGCCFKRRSIDRFSFDQICSLNISSDFALISCFFFYIFLQCVRLSCAVRTFDLRCNCSALGSREVSSPVARLQREEAPLKAVHPNVDVG